MRQRLWHHDVPRLAWSAAAGASTALTAIGLGATKPAGLVAGAAVCAAVFLALRLYASGSPL